MSTPAEELPNIPPTSAQPNWRALLVTRGNRILGDERNILIALRHSPDLAGLFQFNEFGLRVEFTRNAPWRITDAGDPWTDEDATHLLEWLQTNDIPARRGGSIDECVHAVARKNGIHPVREYLLSLKWDGTARLKGWLAAYLGAAEDEHRAGYLGAIGTRFMISAIARIMDPGCKADHVLMLEAPQGRGKSAAVRILACQQDWFTDRLPDLHSKDAQLLLCGRWFIELAELAAIRRSDSLETMKAYITASTDVFRPPFGRRPISVPRQCVFIGTTNESSYLRDPTGNRRFWPVVCGVIDLARLRADRDQLWAEAYDLWRGGEAWHLSEQETELAAAEQGAREYLTEIDHAVEQYVEGSGKSEVTVSELLRFALNMNPDEPGFMERAGRIGNQVAMALRRCGWAKVRTIGRGQQRRTIYAKQKT